MIKTELNQEKEVKELGFPKLMVSKDGSCIILMIRHQAGTVIVGNNIHDTGYFCSVWASGDFKDYKGTITLSNELE
jgi:hypothetical protein